MLENILIVTIIMCVVLAAVCMVILMNVETADAADTPSISLPAGGNLCAAGYHWWRWGCYKVYATGTHTCYMPLTIRVVRGGHICVPNSIAGDGTPHAKP